MAEVTPMKRISIAVFLLALAACGGGGIGSIDLSGISLHWPFAVPGGPYDGVAGQPVQFDGSGSSDDEGHPLTYEWDFGDGGTSTLAMPTHTYAVVGTYTVTLRVCDPADCNINPGSTSAVIGPTTGTGFAKGVVSGFGSIVVGGTHYIIAANTTITVDDNPGSSENELEPGDYVEIHSTFDDNGTTRTFTADTIEAAESAEGPVNLPASVIDGPDTGTLRVLGQTVRVNPVTILDNADFGVGGLEELTDGDYIEVHGLKRPDGSVEASRVERKNPLLTDVVELTGIIGAANSASDSFTINGLTVTYTLAGLQDFGGREPQAGDLVEVKSTSAGLTAGLTLAADSIELKTRGLDGADGDRATVEGFVEDCEELYCRSLGIRDFSVDGVSVQRAVGFSSPDLRNNQKVEVEGSFSGGILIATKIELNANNNVRIEAIVDSNSGTALMLLGATFNYDANTAFEDNSASPVADITQVNTGNYVEVRGEENPLGSTVVLASEVKRDDPPGDGRMIIRGTIRGHSTQPPLVVDTFGVTVALTDSTVCRNIDDLPYPGGCSAFVADMISGYTMVKARGVSFSGGELTADEIELEN
jgi:hypothetical protein